MEAAARLLCLWLLSLLGTGAQVIYRQDRLALLSGTLRTFQVASCDGDELRLECPPDTIIVIKLVQYGRLASKPDLCYQPGEAHRGNSTDCMDRNALKVVIKECGGKQNCRLQTSAKTFGVDPCPGIRKFVEVLFKCRPSQFQNAVVCEGGRKKISCGTSRIAIYSASFGVTEHGSVHCMQPPGVKLPTCLASFTSEKMINQCQGKPSCQLDADPALFSQACPPEYNMYLKVSYTCVPKRILQSRYGQVEDEQRRNATEAPPPDDRHRPRLEGGAPSTPRSGKIHRGPGRGSPRYDGVQGDVSYLPSRPATVPPPPPPPPPTADEACNDTRPMTASQRHVIGFITEWITAYRYVSDNREKFILYLTLSVTGGLLLCLLVVIGRLYCQRRRARQEVKAHYIDPPPHGFTDDISEVDADIDLGPTVLSAGRLSPPRAGQHSFNGAARDPKEPGRYASSGRGTLRGHEHDTNPRSLARAGPNVYYYS